MNQTTILTCAVTGNLTTPEQTAYLPVYAVWAAIVVVAFPPVFGFV